MKKFFRLFLLLGVMVCASNLYAQNMSDMRLNEILVTNTEGFEDDYGYRSGWIELFNTSYGTVDIAGCYLSTDPNNLKMYMIPKGDVITRIAPRQHILFWADGYANRGTFHLGFTLDGAKEVIFTGGDGKTIIDRIALPGLEPNTSYGRKYDGKGSSNALGFFYTSYNNSADARAAAADGTEHGWMVMANPTPSTNNSGTDEVSKSMMMSEADPYGIFMTVTAMSVTFLALILLYLVFKHSGKFHIKKTSETAKKATADSHRTEEHVTTGEVSAETYAAISMAMHLYFRENETHDYENTVLTMHKVSKTYSPWSSKIYTLRETPQLRKK